MINRIIEWSSRNRVAVFLITAVLALWGGYSLYYIDTDALPDLSDTQVIVYTDFPEQSPQTVETRVTYPLTTALRSVPGARVVRGFSSFGLSFVYVLFDDGVDPYWARSRVLEYLDFAARDLPPGVRPNIGPDATGVGWVYQYALIDRSGNHDLADLRALQDTYLRFELRSIPGVAEVASVGGFVKQFQIELDPAKLSAYRISLMQIKEVLARSGGDVGGRSLELSETEFMVRGIGQIHGVEDIEKIAIKAANGAPVRIRDLGRVIIGPASRRGIAEYNGEGEAVGGIVVMRSGENARRVIKTVKLRLDELKSGLPKGVEIVPVYDRSRLIDAAVNNLRNKVVQEIVIVCAVCLLFLWSVRAAAIAAITVPLGLLVAFLIMRWQNIDASIMSLGGIAIAIGVMIDAAIVLVENANKRLEVNPANRQQAIIDAAREVGPALFFSLLVVTVSFLPVLALQAQEGRLFAPLAYTKTYAMAAAALLSITLIPALMLFMAGKPVTPESRNPINRFFLSAYRPSLDFLLKRRKLALFLAGITLLSAIWPLSRLGSEFMPPLHEGDLLYMPTTFPEISPTKTREILQQTDRIIRSFPEVETVFGKAGRAETATDPAPMMMLETTIQLKPRQDWRPGLTPEKLIELLNRAVNVPGVANTWTMPIKGRIEMLTTGVKAPVGLKIAGPDLAVLERLAIQAEQIMKTIPGAINTYAERNLNARYLDIQIDRDAIARYGLTVGDVQDVIASAVGGENVASVQLGLQRYGISLRYPRAMRDSPEEIGRIRVPIASGGAVALSQLSEIVIRTGAATIRTENGRPSAWVYSAFDGRDLGGFIADARQAINTRLMLPEGYSVAWSGQFEHWARMTERMWLVVPLTLAAIFLLLYFNFRDVGRSLIVMLALPFALVGGVWFMYLLGYAWSVATIVGLIALAGVAAETVVVMLVYLDSAYNRYLQIETMNSQRLHAAIMEGAAERLRPKLMTTLAVIGGLLPILWGEDAGSEVMSRIAAPMVGGMVTSAILTLYVIPIIYRTYRITAPNHSTENDQ